MTLSPPSTGAHPGSTDAFTGVRRPRDPFVALSEIALELASAPRARDGIQRALARLRTDFGATAAALCIGDRERRVVFVEAMTGPLDELRPRFGHGVAGRVIDSGRPIVVPRVTHEPMALSELRGPSARLSGTVGLVAVPVPLRGSQSGALSVYFEDAEPLANDRLNMLQILAVHVAQALRAGEGGVEPSSPDASVDPDPFEYANMIGTSPAMRQVYEQIGQVASTTATALIRGESGTGKELIAEAIHSNSARSARPFVRVNCGALPEALFESELFGHERGAFTGAHARKIGRFELACGGTLFLDEVGELPLSTQVKLLRILQAREFERVGGIETLQADVRLVAATNRDLEAAVRAGTFREDLYYRLNVFSISVPPLRQRNGDVQLLAEFFMQKHAARHTRRIRRISGAAMSFLQRHEWPGNVRELENAIERAVVVCSGSILDELHLPDSVRGVGPTRPSGAETLADAVAQLERWMIEHALRDAGGNLARAARALGATERVLRYKAGKYGIEASRFRS